MEQWAKVPSLVGVESSTEGRIRVDGILRSQSLTGKTRGYYAVKIRGTLVKVHRLVCEAFNGPPGLLPQVNHKNGNSKDNRPDNLEWCDNRYNVLHAIKIGVLVHHKGSDVLTAKIDEDISTKIRSDVARGLSHRKAADKFGISKTQVTRIVNGICWKHTLPTEK